MEPLLRALFAIRAANIVLGLGLKWLDSFGDSCSFVGNTIQFDEDDFITRYLNKNAEMGKNALFRKTLVSLKTKVGTERRLFIRGHDFIYVLSWYLRKSTSKNSILHKPEVLQKLLMAYIDQAALIAGSFSKDLRRRYAVGTFDPRDQ